MFGTTKIASIDFNSNKNCFLSLPNAWAQEFRRKEASVFELQWGENGKGYLSWAGDVSRPVAGSSNNDAAIQINGLLGSKLGLRHGQEVLLKPVTSVWSCYKLEVEPASVDDWEILELNSSYVENNLLNQVRVVWVGQVLPVWIDRKMCVFIKISSMEPDAPCVRLEQNTEMCISPKNRLSSPTHLSAMVPRPNHLPGLGALPSKSRSDSGSASSSSEASTTNTSVSGYISDFDSMNSYSSGYEHAWSHDTGQVTHQEEGGDAFRATSLPWEVNSQDIEGSIPLAYKVWRGLRALVTGRRATEDAANRLREDCANEEDARRKMAAQFWRDVRIVARVQPMFRHRRPRKSQGMTREGSACSLSETTEELSKNTSSAEVPRPRRPTNRFTRQMSMNSQVPKPKEPVGSVTDTSSHIDALSHIMQPTTVYLSSLGDSEFLWQYAASMDDESTPSSEYVTFLATLTKMPSPRERNEDLKKKLLQESKKEQASVTQNPLNSGTRTNSAGKPPSSDSKSSSDSPETADEGSLTSCVVRIIVHCHELKSHCKRTGARNPYSSTVFQERPTEWHLQVPDLLRRQMGLELSSLVQLKPVVNPPSPIRDLTLSPLFDLTETIDESRSLRAFSQWLSCVSCMITPIPIVQHRNLLSFPITSDFVGEFLLSINRESTEAAAEAYFLLHPFITRQAELRLGERPKTSETGNDGIRAALPAKSVDELDATVKGFRLRELGSAMTELGRQALDHISAALSSRPLGRQLCAPAPGQRHGGVLICGGRGCGKSTLARAVCREVSEWPLLAFVKVVECHSLKGKGVDTIRKIWEEAFNEAAWRQPSVVLLDDLDHVTSAPLGPEQESGPEAVYNARLAHVLKDLMSNEVSEGSRIGVIATCASKKSIHQSLLSSRGLHIFQSCLEITPLSKVDRASLLASVIHSKVEIDLRTLDRINTEALSGKMEGFVAADLVAVTERAVHAGSSREIAQGLRVAESNAKDGEQPHEIVLWQEDFEFALHSYSPAALRDVPLHSAGELGWRDVGGLKGVKQDLIETLELPAKYPDLFANCPLRLRSGLLLYGPPGTGKTLLGGVVARECGLNFISIKGPELLSKYIGASEQAVRDLFTRAMSAKPCILFFDEFDSLAPRRGHDSTGVTDRVVNQLLTQLDGVEGLEGVYVIGATSRPDLIDPALLRPGRLDKCIYCPIPMQEERVEILEALARNMTLSNDVDLAAVARHLDHFTGADLKALLYNAQLEAIHTTLMQSDQSEGLPLLTPSSLHNCSMEADEWKLTFVDPFSESEPGGGTPVSNREDSRGGVHTVSALAMHHRLASLSEAERALAAENMKMTADDVHDFEEDQDVDADRDIDCSGGGDGGGVKTDNGHVIDGLRRELGQGDGRMDGLPAGLRHGVVGGLGQRDGENASWDQHDGGRDPSRLRLDLDSSDLNGNLDTTTEGAVSNKMLLADLMKEDQDSDNEEAPSPPEGSTMDCLMAGESSPQTPPPEQQQTQQQPSPPTAQQQQRVVFMPTLRDGVIDPTPETKEIIANEVALIVDNYTRKITGDNSDGSAELLAGEDQAVIRVTQTHLTRAAQGMRPSVSAKERMRYQQIYETFVRSRGGDFPQNQQPTGSKQKVTLA